MACLNPLKLSLRQLENTVTEFSYQLDDAFYQGLEQTEIKGGLVQAKVVIKKVADAYDVTLTQQGYIVVECQRCLDDMSWQVDVTDHLVVKFGTDLTEQTDELVVIGEQELFDIGWYLFEFAALTIPICPTHEEGECNPEMEEKLKEYAPGEKSDEIDPRWEQLKSLINN
ncbi:MAG: DUF177 domain-containing protein [Paludibacteraceae bacterium]|jgi:uncharacterized metal-binding protein YceD (DUF177 family)|nr:DUF177 domain-containing protein [Paludibacteraceae bacterium]MED9995801.1 DUF177 domain-containing protein [Paludibacteraceae bacterium]